MNIRFLKATTSLCVVTMLLQPMAGLAQATPEPPRAEPCAEGDRECRQAARQLERQQARQQNRQQERAAEGEAAAAEEAREAGEADALAAQERRQQERQQARQQERQQTRAAEEEAEKAAEEARKAEEAETLAAQERRQQERQQARQQERAAEEEAEAARKAEEAEALAAQERRQLERQQERQQARQQERVESREAEERKAEDAEAEAAAERLRQERAARRDTREERAADALRDAEAAKTERLALRTRRAEAEAAAAAASADDLASDPNAAPIRLESGDVRRSFEEYTRRDRDRDRDRARDRERDRDRDRDRNRRPDDWNDRYGDWRDQRAYERWREDERKKSGLSDFQKYGLIALGAVAVGAIIYGSQTVVSNEGGRVVTRDDEGRYDIYRDDDALIRRPGSTVYTRPYDDGSVQSRVELEDGTIVTTVLDADGRVLRRTVQRPSAQAFVLYDDTRPEAAIAPAALSPRSPVRIVYDRRTSSQLLLAAFASEPASAGDRRFSLRQVRNSQGVRHQTPIVEVSSLTFAPGSAAVSAEQADSLATLGDVMADMIDRNPYEVFLIQGHTDTTGDPARNLTLSDQRAESVALALTELFGVPPENMVIQGYGQEDLHEPVRGASEVNRRVSVRRVTDLLDPVAGG